MSSQTNCDHCGGPYQKRVGGSSYLRYRVGLMVDQESAEVLFPLVNATAGFVCQKCRSFAMSKCRKVKGLAISKCRKVGRRTRAAYRLPPSAIARWRSGLPLEEDQEQGTEACAPLDSGSPMEAVGSLPPTNNSDEANVMPHSLPAQPLLYKRGKKPTYKEHDYAKMVASVRESDNLKSKLATQKECANPFGSGSTMVAVGSLPPTNSSDEVNVMPHSLPAQPLPYKIPRRKAAHKKDAINSARKSNYRETLEHLWCLKQGRQAIIEFVKHKLKEELRSVQGTRKLSTLHKSATMENVQEFRWSNVVQEAKSVMPFTMVTLKGLLPSLSSVKRKKRKGPRTERKKLTTREARAVWNLKAGNILAILLFMWRPDIYNLWQSVLGVEMWHQGATQKLITIFHRLGLCQAVVTVRSKVNQICTLYDRELMEKAEVANVPDATVMNVPDATVMNVPDATVMNVPDATIMNIPDATFINVPDATNMNVPDAPVMNVPDAMQQPPDTRLSIKGILTSVSRLKLGNGRKHKTLQICADQHSKDKIVVILWENAATQDMPGLNSAVTVTNVATKMCSNRMTFNSTEETHVKPDDQCTTKDIAVTSLAEERCNILLLTEDNEVLYVAPSIFSSFSNTVLEQVVLPFSATVTFNAATNVISDMQHIPCSASVMEVT
ncbi:uncharacterized protein LOC119725904 isoform X2 [Patiria miniata]|uniref:Uncharacterized protein n=1 Tax=Patiria miniata TaxID=46514 RepID=A0A913ZQS9_PATMI|nr:uncharacterized protein LOC119725904 isoform X2 [Patiria miniata]